MRCDYIILPAAEPDEAPHWLRVADGRIVKRGIGPYWRQHDEGETEAPVDGRALLVLPPHATTLHWIACPEMTIRQGAVAARLMALEASIGAPSQLHAATLESSTPATPHIVAVTSETAMAHWINWCEDNGLPQASFVPAALLLPEPDQAPAPGFVRGKLGPSEVLRGPDSAFDGNEPVADLIVGEAPVTALSVEAVEDALLAALAVPPLDLRQGSFARARPGLIERDQVVRIAQLTGFVLIVSLLVALVQIGKVNLEASRIDEQTVALARTVDPSITEAVEAESKITARLASRGGDTGFTGVMAGLMSAMRVNSAVSLTSVSQTADGSVRVQLAAASAEQINEVLIAIQEAGWRISANAVQERGGRLLADIMVVR